MSRRWVVDASPLILLAQIQEIHLLEQLATTLVIPQSVFDEVASGPDWDQSRRWLADRHELVAPLISVPTEVAEWGLGAGESAAISHALQDHQCEVILDDAAGRACAASFGIRVRGTLGVVLLAKQAGLIRSVRPKLDALKDAGMWIDGALFGKALELAGEGTS